MLERGILEGNNFKGQSHEAFAPLLILSASNGYCQGKSRRTGAFRTVVKKSHELDE